MIGAALGPVALAVTISITLCILLFGLHHIFNDYSINVPKYDQWVKNKKDAADKEKQNHNRWDKINQENKEYFKSL